MAQLNLVLGSIMRDIIQAQHEANMYSYSLREQYGRDGKAKDFQLPGASISDVEMTLNYGVIDTNDTTEQFSIRYEKFNKFMRGLVTSVSKKAIYIICDYIMTNGLQSPKGQEFITKLRKKGEVYQEYLQYVSNILNSSYDGSIHELIDTHTGIPNEEEITKTLSDAVIQQIIYDSETTKDFFNDSDGNAKKAMSARVTSEIQTLVSQTCLNKKFKRTKSFPVLNVAVTADELNAMPSGAIHTCKLRFTPTTCSVRCSDDDTSIATSNIEDIIR